MRPRPACTALAAAIAALAAWRAACVLAGPDVDTDAYAHHMIARAILADPRDLAVHWVWLPLFHYLQVPLVALGATMDDVRWVNVMVSAALPLLVFLYVRRTVARSAPPAAWGADATALFAAVLAAACPIAMQMGTTAQPEPLFALVMFCAAVDFQEERHGRAAAWLGAAVLLRYEAWASLAGVCAVVCFRAWRPQRDRAPALRSAERRAWIVVAVPATLILVWSALRRPIDGCWFGFLSQTRAFANGVAHEASALDGGLSGLLRALVYYPLLVAARVMGPAVALVPFGLARTLRQQGTRFVIVLSACLAFVSATWVARSSLGLDRHFVVVVPLYAICAAQGAGAVADRTARWAARSRVRRLAPLLGRRSASALAIACTLWMAIALHRWMRYWKGSIERGWPERVAMGAYLRSLPVDATIFCDEATVEILSGLDRRRFDRHWIDDPHTWQLVEGAAARRGVAYVATWDRKLRGHELAGSVVYRSRRAEADPGSGLAVVRVVAGEGRASR